jgi:DNA mismatch endonuclease (patch repair protein)
VHHRGIAGTLDIVFTRAKVAVFCDSSFWHGRWLTKDVERIHSHREYWRSKLTMNAARDRRVDDELTSEGWCVLRFWDDDINDRLQRSVSAVRSSVIRGLHEHQ